jgi:hypothetical protein
MEYTPLHRNSLFTSGSGGESKQELNKAKTETLAKISTTFKIEVKSITVIWSGKGYHIYIPVADVDRNKSIRIFRQLL